MQSTFLPNVTLHVNIENPPHLINSKTFTPNMDAIKDHASPRKTIRTRICIISDTHNAQPALPAADLLIHCGDLTNVGHIAEYAPQIAMLKAAPAPLKMVIAGNHDITLDREYYARMGQSMHFGKLEDLDEAREMWTCEETRKVGVIYLEEGMRMIELANGARFSVYSSPYTPEFCDWAFPYRRSEDRFNSQSQSGPRNEVENPVPDFPSVDLMITHGPPMGIMDVTDHGEHVGCQHLMRAVGRARPLLHCFGHIHEGWGAGRMDWSVGESMEKERSLEKVAKEGHHAYYDGSEKGGMPVDWGKETVFVNASIMDVKYRPINKPWVVDLDLPVRKEAG